MAFARVIVGHRLGWRHKPDAFPSFRAWWAIDIAVLGVVAKPVCSRDFAPKPPPVIVEPEPVPVEPTPMGKAWPTWDARLSRSRRRDARPRSAEGAHDLPLGPMADRRGLRSWIG